MNHSKINPTFFSILCIVVSFVLFLLSLYYNYGRNKRIIQNSCTEKKKKEREGKANKKVETCRGRRITKKKGENL